MFGKPVYEKATDAEGNNPNISTWHYDSLGRVIRAVCDGHSYEYVYDAQGNLKEKRSSGKRLVSYAYDKAGQITEMKDPAGGCTRYEYDILGRRSRIYNDDGLEVRYGYDALNRISKIHYGNGVETAYAYDGDGNISSLETKAGEKILLSFAYRYDGNGNRTAKVGTQAGTAMGGITSVITAGNNALDISYRYDVRGQLLEERRNGDSVCYAYDKAGNQIRKTDSQGTIIYQFNRKNQLIIEENNDGKNQFTYDRQGGIVEEKNAAGIRLFSYNSRHQQTKVETESGNVQENLYDVENLRFELLENGRCTSFAYHNGELLHEEGGENRTSYYLGAGLDALQRGQDLFYYHRDEQFSTAFITGADREIQNSYLYDAFGDELEVKEQLQNRIRYTGQQYDDLTGQYYLRARYYNPVLGRFMQEDVYQDDGLNLYAYCENNPVVYYDPSGYAKAPQQSGDGCPPNGNIDDDGNENNRNRDGENGENEQRRLVNINDCTDEDLADPNVRIYGSYEELSNAGIKDAHHLLQDAAMRDVDGYARGDAPAIQANGPSTLKDSEHYNLTYAQSHAEQAGTYGIEKQIGLDAVTNEFNLNTSDVSTLSSFIDDYFVDRLHLNENSTTRVPGNRHNIQ